MIIAVRTLNINSAGKVTPVDVRIFMPEADDHVFICRYEIDWPDGTIASRAQGNDMVEALHLALHKLGSEMYMSRYHHEGTLSWRPGWVGYNFPLPKNGRDLLIGDDQRFFGLDEK
ncbi:hypothetical protein [Devosia sp. FKR38]|uniref:DUF6968 family protein n=1 Tax=Devosia sp. FKR38 TaxID=2562312 RepID=UPI0010C10885|nr:hypothetical protein [Devosia sp. FKR38]